MPEIASSLSDPIRLLRTLVLRHQPPQHARMTEPPYTAKYLRTAQPVGDHDLAAHLAGDLTLACVLHTDGVAFVAACDIDAGGETMVRAVMRAAEVRACHAYGFVLDSGAHNGGHVWIFFEHAHTIDDLQVLMRDIVSDAQCPTTEIYPTGADLRLPFGLHRRCNRRGTILLNSAAVPLDLDSDPHGALATFLDQVRLTSDLPVRIARDTQQARRDAVAQAIAAARPRQVDPQAHWRDVIASFNSTTDLVSLLEQYGARVAYHYPGGKALLHCASAQDHAHGDTHPSLVVEPGRGHQTGKMICGCYCPTCRLHNQPGQVMDAFEVFCRLEGIAKRECVQRIQTHATPQERVSLAPQPPERHPSSHAKTASAPAARPPHASPRAVPSVAERFLQQRLVEITTDPRVQPLDRRLLAYIISHGAQGQGIANAALAAALGARPDSIKRAKRRLRTLGYIAVQISTDGQSASVMTILAPDHEGDAAGGVQEAPPSHVSESTCDAATPPPESSADGFAAPPVSEPLDPEGQPSLAVPDAVLESKRRRRRGVLLGMLRAGVDERRRRAFVAELAEVEAALADSIVDEPAHCLSEREPLHQASLEQVAVASAPCLAHPDDPHPPVSDARLSAVVRDLIQDALPASCASLLDRVSWHQQECSVVVRCAPRDLAAVTAHLLAPSQRALCAMGLTDSTCPITVQIGQPELVEIRPPWLDADHWRQVPVWLRSALIGSAIVQGRLYGLTPVATARLAQDAEIVGWLLAPIAPSQTENNQKDEISSIDT